MVSLNWTRVFADRVIELDSRRLDHEAMSYACDDKLYIKPDN